MSQPQGLGGQLYLDVPCVGMERSLIPTCVASSPFLFLPTEHATPFSIFLHEGKTLIFHSSLASVLFQVYYSLF